MESVNSSSTSSILLALAVTISVSVWFHKKQQQQQQQNSNNDNHKEPPMVPGGIPILGHAVEFGKNPAAFLLHCHAHYGGAFQIRLVHKTYVMLDGALHKTYFSLPEKSLSFDQALLSTGVASDSTVGRDCVTSPWHVPLLKRALLEKNMMHYTARIERQVYTALLAFGISEETLPVGDATIVLEDLKLLAWNVVAHSSATSFLGEDLVEKNPHIIEVFMEFHKACLLVIQASNFLPESMVWIMATQVKKYRQALRNVIVPEVERRRAGKKENSSNGDDGNSTSSTDEDLLNWMVDTGRPAEDLADRFLAMIFASMITTAGAMTNALYDLAGHQGEWQVLLDEQADMIKEHGTAVTQKALQDMSKLHAFVMESIRCAALPIQQTRVVAKEGIELEPGSGVYLPKGAIVAISGILANTLVDQSDKFMPERFLNKDGTLLDDPSSIGFYPFGIGRHYCPGRHFAHLEIKATLTVLLRNFRFKTVSGGIPQYKSTPADTARIPEPVQFSKVAPPV